MSEDKPITIDSGRRVSLEVGINWQRFFLEQQEELRQVRSRCDALQVALEDAQCIINDKDAEIDWLEQKLDDLNALE